MSSNFNSDTRFGTLSSKRIFKTPNERIANNLFFDPHCDFKTLVARGKVEMKIKKNESCQCVSIYTGHDKIIGARCIVEKMPLVIHPNAYLPFNETFIFPTMVYFRRRDPPPVVSVVAYPPLLASRRREGDLLVTVMGWSGVGCPGEPSASTLDSGAAPRFDIGGTGSVHCTVVNLTI